LAPLEPEPYLFAAGTALRSLRIKLFHLPTFPINIARNQNANNQKRSQQ